jgi:hypothetical protein
MARPLKSERLQAVHTEALRRFDVIQAALKDERAQCVADRRFYSIAGGQWEGPLGEQFENKPRFEVNKCMLAVIRIFNEYRNNRITVDFRAKDGSDDQTADMLDGLYRADEADSGGQEALDNAFEEAVGGGFGAWRLRTVYEDEEDVDNERQRIVIEPIYDADSSVWFDLDAKRQDKADAKFAFVVYSRTPASYTEEFGDDPASWPKTVDGTSYDFDWCTPDVVYIAEYYVCEEERGYVSFWRTVTGEEERYTDEDFDADETLEETLLAVGSEEVRRRKIERKRVRKYILNGNRVLEDCGYIAGRCIPIIPVYGKRWFVDNIERCMGHVRLAKDSQRLKNMQLSRLGEISALSPLEKPIFVPEQVAGLDWLWAEDNIVNRPYLLVNPVTGPNGEVQPTGPIGYTKPPAVPPAMAALLQITETDMADILGSQQGAEKVVSNISGKAVELIQQRLDMQTFIYMSNMAKAVRRCGEVWLSMAKECYAESGRVLKTVGPQGETEPVEMMRPVLVEGAQTYENDLTKAKFDVTVDVGPSFTSRRDATVRAVSGMLQFITDPQDAQVMQGVALMNMDGEGLEDARRYFRRKLVAMGVVKPTEKEIAEAQAAAAQAAQQPPSAQDQYLAAEAGKADAQAAQARANTVKTIADAGLSEAKTIETLAGVDLDKQAGAIATAKAISEISERHSEMPGDAMGSQPALMVE